MTYDKSEASDWDADPEYDRKLWIKERTDELVEDGYHKATAHIKAVRDYNDEMGLN